MTTRPMTTLAMTAQHYDNPNKDKLNDEGPHMDNQRMKINTTPTLKNPSFEGYYLKTPNRSKF